MFEEWGWPTVSEQGSGQDKSERLGVVLDLDYTLESSGEYLLHMASRTYPQVIVLTSLD